MKNSHEKKIQQIVNSIFKNVIEKEWCCLYPECTSKSINSHLLQKNGIISNISEDNHVIQITPERNRDEGKNNILFSKIGINKTIALPLFCNFHDTNVFKKIETIEVPHNDYESQLLFSYRALCGELRKKEQVVEWYKRMQRSKTLYGELNEKNLSAALLGNEKGVSDLSYYKRELESNLSNMEERKFTFTSFRYPKINICASVVFSLLSNELKIEQALQHPDPWDAVFVNLIPLESEMIIIVGHHIKTIDTTVEHYINQWKELNETALKIKVTELISTKAETWCMSPSLYKKIPKEKIDKFMQLWDDNLINFYPTDLKEFNLFD